MPYPLCWSCNTSFGVLVCSQCGITRYCCKKCQVEDWKARHKTVCQGMRKLANCHSRIVIDHDSITLEELTT
jgi:hypothetical protein